jgi:hypothetical protein
MCIRAMSLCDAAGFMRKNSRLIAWLAASPESWSRTTLESFDGTVG